MYCMCAYEYVFEIQEWNAFRKCILQYLSAHRGSAEAKPCLAKRIDNSYEEVTRFSIEDCNAVGTSFGYIICEYDCFGGSTGTGPGTSNLASK